MSVTVKGSEQSLAGDFVEDFLVELSSERTTVKELIRSRVFQKVKDYNVNERQRAGDKSEQLVPRDESELILNGRSHVADRTADWHTEFDRAVEAFQKHQILIFVNQKQLTDLEEVVQVDSTSDICFLRFTLLAGG